MTKVHTVVNSKTTKDYFRSLIQLMKSQTGTNNVVIEIEKSTGEILMWGHKDSYQKNYAIIALIENGQLTPKSEKIRKKLIKYAYENKVIEIKYSGEKYCLFPYSSEIHNAVVTVGYVLKKIDASILL